MPFTKKIGRSSARFSYTKLVFLSIKLLIAPIPKPIPTLPTKHNIIWITPASSGLAIEIIINKNIPTPSDKHIASHDFCLPITLIVKKIEEKIQQLEERGKRDPMDWYKQKFEQEMEELNARKYSEYERMANSDFSKSTKSPEVKNAHQLFVDKISGNGAYHTYGKNAQNSGVQTKSSPEINQNIQKQIKSDDIAR